MAKVMISIADGLLKKVDQVAKKRRRSRSEVIREALHADLTNQAVQRRSWKNALAPLRSSNSSGLASGIRPTSFATTDRRLLHKVEAKPLDVHVPALLLYEVGNILLLKN